jgi:DnaJ family protein C protein 11
VPDTKWSISDAVPLQIDLTHAQATMDDPGPTSSFLRTFPQTRDGPVRPTSPPLEPLLTDVQEEESSDESLYTILNLARDATEAEIRDRYRSLATTFHPDRQRDDRSRLAAHGRFTSIQRAYEILTDSTKRTIYDLFGEEGLKTSWELGPRIRTKEEMRAEFQRQAGEKRRVLDARAVFVPRTAFKDPDAISHTPWARLQRVRPGQIVMKHSFETPVGDTTQLQVTGQMASRNGAGGGNVVGTVRHQFSPKFWVEGGAGLLKPRVLTGKATYTVDENTYVSLQFYDNSS